LFYFNYFVVIGSKILNFVFIKKKFKKQK